MGTINKEYSDYINQLKESVQASEQLAAYLEEESEELYKAFQDAYEPAIVQFHIHVATNDPMQLLLVEQALADDHLEGLFLPKMLGYSILRGEVNEQVKYVRQQDHFKFILNALCHSANFEIIKNRCGQTIQVGFSLSSDIWITNLFNSIENKKIKTFLQAMKADKLKDLETRRTVYHRYLNQFKNEIYFYSEYPTDVPSLKVLNNTLRTFMTTRIEHHLDNTALVVPTTEMLLNPLLRDEPELVHYLGIYLNFFPQGSSESKKIVELFNQLRKDHPGFNGFYFQFLREMLNSKSGVNSEADAQVTSLIDKSIKDDITAYYKLLVIVNKMGYVHEDSVEAIRSFYTQHAGLSIVNECVRKVIYNHLHRFITNLDPADYLSIFDLHRTVQAYMGIFTNEHFNQDLKHITMDFIMKTTRKFVDKRGKDFQDIRKFVTTSLVDLGFIKEKDAIDLLKTKRVKPAVKA